MYVCMCVCFVCLCLWLSLCLCFCGFGTKGAFFEYDVRRCDAEIIITAAAAAGVQVGKVGKDK